MVPWRWSYCEPATLVVIIPSLPSFTSTVDCHPADEAEKVNSSNSFIAHKYGITSTLFLELTGLKWYKKICRGDDVMKEPLCQGHSRFSKCDYGSVNRFCAQLFGKAVLRAWVVAHSSIVLTDAVVSIDYSMEMSWCDWYIPLLLVLDLTVDICMLENDCQELGWGTGITINLRSSFHLLPIFASASCTGLTCITYQFTLLW